MIIKNVCMLSRSSRSILPSRFKYSMIRMCAGGLELPTISLPPGWSHLYVLCPWDWTKAGIRFNSTSQISHAEPMEAIISKRYEWQFTPIAESEESTFLIAFILKRSFHPSSNSSCPSKSSNDVVSILYNQKSNNNASISVVNREDHSHFIHLLRSSLVRFIAKCVRVHIVFTYSIHQGRAFRQIIQQFILDGFSPLGRELFYPFSHQDLRLIAKLDFTIVQLSTSLSRFDTSYLSWSLFLLFIRTFSFSLYLPSLFSFDKEILTPVWYDSFWCQLVHEVEQVLGRRYIISAPYQHFVCLNEGILSCFEDLYDVHRARVTSYGLIQAGQIMPVNLL